MLLRFGMMQLTILLLHVSNITYGVLSCLYYTRKQLFFTCPELLVDFVIALTQLVRRLLGSVFHVLVVFSYVFVLLFGSRLRLVNLG